MNRNTAELFDWQKICGHYYAKDLLEVAASGNHAILLVGSPATGKTMLVRSLMTILPEVPFVEPHCLTDDALCQAMEQARGGILFLNHLEQWDESSLVLLRETVTQQPGKFLLVATTYYCPCGNLRDEEKACTCTEVFVELYQQRLSPTIDACFALEAQITSRNVVSTVQTDEPSLVVCERVNTVRSCQYQHNGSRLNSALSMEELAISGALDAPAQKLMETAHEQLTLTPTQERFLRQVARTNADLAGMTPITHMVTGKSLAYAISALPRWEKRSPRRGVNNEASMV